MMSKFSRRSFLGGSVAVAGGLVLAEHLRFLEPSTGEFASTEQLLTGKEVVYRTGHSNNCDGACGHLVHVTDGRVTMIGPAGWGTKTISGEPAPTFNPRICLRGLSQISNTYSPDRIKYPYKRVGARGSGKWQRITWEEATTLIATKFKEIQDKYGKTSVWIAPYTGSLSLIEGVVGAGFRFASVIGASAGDSEGDNEGDSATPAGWNYVLVDPTNPSNGGGFFTGHESVDFLSAKTIVFWANNVAETSLPDWRIMCDARDQNGTKLISVDPRYTVTCAQSDDWVPIRPGADTALIDGIINYVMQNGLYDAEYIRKNTVGPYLVDPSSRKWLRAKDVIHGAKDDYVVFDVSDGKLKAASDPSLKTPAVLGTHTAGRIESPTALQLLSDMAAKYTPEYTSRLTDVPASQVVALAKLWGSSKPLAVRVGFGLSHWYHGDLHMQALLTLQAITGNIGVHGGGVTTFAGGITTSAFDFLDFWAPKGTKLYTLLEPMDFCSAVEESKPFPVKAAWFMIDNFAQQMSDRNRVIAAMKQLEFVVVSDYNLSATADLADVILPACTYFEKTDLLSSNNFYLQYMPKIIDPLFESRSDLDAISMVAEKMGFGQYFNQTPEAYLKQMLRMGQPDVDPTVKGLTWEQLTTDTVHLNTDPMPYVPFFNQQYPTKSGKIEFYVEMLVPFDQELCDHKEPVEASPTNPLFKKYPLVFLSTHTRFRTHSQFVNLPWLKELNNGGDGFLEINPRDAAPRGIADGAVVRIFNDRGEMKVRARLTESMKPGVVNCYQGGWDTIRIKHYIEGHPNNLTHQIAKPAQALIPNFPSNAAYYDCLVQVEQAGA
jgi:anaerobic selenocysteine-containing dehydrogenase